ncbi:histidine kinase [Marinospirillum sp.]|uniref:sensor histidine kinase n=1 Tax=Marinospirillum sp. TaxID=2183934 RepID=UPI0028702AD1|nr:histidine kinase [Marinospirillum sp.]MDR9468486.1 histidine kinase [Marinospirillum sp.]
MNSASNKPLLKELLQNLLFTSFACLIISVLMTLLSPLSLLSSLKVSFSYGLTMTLLLNLFMVWWPHQPIWLTAGSGTLLGLLLGTSVMILEIHGTFALAFQEQPLQLLGNLAIGLIFSVTVCYFFYIHYQTQRLRAQQAEKEKSLALSQLRVLQSQMEPHFLFNTLANIQGLVDEEPDTAKQMIQALTALLRSNLAQVRSDTSNLGQELDLVTAYLDIQQLRMGNRLHWTLQCPPHLLAQPVAPLLLQPLVENAIKHGLEPLPQGGELHLMIQQQGQQLQITLNDTGQGFTQHSPTAGQGLGLSNLRKRLQLLYGDQVQLQITQPATGGTRVELCLPLTTPGEAPHATHLSAG